MWSGDRYSQKLFIRRKRFKFGDEEFPLLKLDANLKDWLQERSVQLQIENAYFKQDSIAVGAGSDQLIGQRSLREQMFALAGEMTTKELECKELRQEAYAACDTRRDDPRACEDAARPALQCEAEYDAMKIEVKRLECEMARLQGVEDTLEDCE